MITIKRHLTIDGDDGREKSDRSSPRDWCLAVDAENKAALVKANARVVQLARLPVALRNRPYTREKRGMNEWRKEEEREEERGPAMR